MSQYQKAPIRAGKEHVTTRLHCGKMPRQYCDTTILTRGKNVPRYCSAIQIIYTSIRYYSPPHTSIIRTRLFRIPRYFELKTISLGFVLQSFTIGYFELPRFRIVLRFPWQFEIAGLNCNVFFSDEEDVIEYLVSQCISLQGVITACSAVTEWRLVRTQCKKLEHILIHKVHFPFLSLLHL